MRAVLLSTLMAAGVCGCVSTPPPDPVTMEEIVQLSRAGPESPALAEAIGKRPLAFPLTFTSLKRLQEKGVPAAVLDVVIALAVERRARSLAPRYGYYDPYPSPFYFGIGFRYHHHHR